MDYVTEVSEPCVKQELKKRKSYKNPLIYNFNCECGKNFSFKGNFDAHRKKFHGETTEVKRNNIQKCCPLCEYSSINRCDMIKHFGDVHDISSAEDKHTFESENNFLLWKSKIESDTHAKFSNKGTQKLPNYKITYFYCHRSGYYVTRGKGLRSLKAQGSCKMSSFCPARIVKKHFNDGTCIVHFYGTHVGHQNELKYLNLTATEREEIAKKLSQKVSFDEILAQTRDSLNHVLSSQRIHLLKRKDLYNIESSFNLRSKAVRHKGDAVSLSMDRNISGNKENKTQIVESQNESIAVSLEENNIHIRKEKLRNAFLEYLDAVSNIEELEVMEKSFAQVPSTLATIRENSLSALETKQDIVANKNITCQRLQNSTKRKKLKIGRKFPDHSAAEVCNRELHVKQKSKQFEQVDVLDEDDIIENIAIVPEHVFSDNMVQHIKVEFYETSETEKQTSQPVEQVEEPEQVEEVLEQDTVTAMYKFTREKRKQAKMFYVKTTNNHIPQGYEIFAFQKNK